MNIFNSHILLVCLFMSAYFTAGASVDLDTFSPTEDSKKELIIVNVDENLSSSLDQLATYVQQLFGTDDAGNITIKRYISDGDEKSKKSINSLVVLLVQKGIPEDHIEVADEALKLDHPYFTLTVSEGPDVQ